MPEYTDRHTEPVMVEKLDKDSWKSSAGWSIGLFEELRGKIAVGDVLIVETRGISHLVGVRKDGQEEWLYRRSDEDLEAEHQEYRERLSREYEEMLAANRADWTRRTNALPQWVKERIEVFQEGGGHRFETNGWGYELVIAELTVLYFASDGVDSDEVEAYAREEGTSGNQHDFAKALAKLHQEGKSLAGTVAGLTPITGDPFYQKQV